MSSTLFPHKQGLDIFIYRNEAIYKKDKVKLESAILCLMERDAL